jgi:hypothetical protein
MVSLHCLILVWIQDLGRVIFFRKHYDKSPLTYILGEIGICILRKVKISELGRHLTLYQKNGSFDGSNWIQEYEIHLDQEKIATAKAKLVAFDFKSQKKMEIPRQAIEYFTSLPVIQQSKL